MEAPVVLTELQMVEHMLADAKNELTKDEITVRCLQRIQISMAAGDTTAFGRAVVEGQTKVRGIKARIEQLVSIHAELLAKEKPERPSPVPEKLLAKDPDGSKL